MKNGKKPSPRRRWHGMAVTDEGYLVARKHKLESNRLWRPLISLASLASFPQGKPVVTEITR